MLLAIAVRSVVATLIWIFAMCAFAAIFVHMMGPKLSDTGQRIVWGAVALLSVLLLLNLIFGGGPVAAY